MLTSQKPVIGLTVSEDSSASVLRLPRTCSSALLENGAVPLLLPLPLSPEDCSTITQRLDGFVFTGGPDVHPFLFGEETSSGCESVSLTRDQSELCLFEAAFRMKKPILAICRGMQLANIALGGSIYQDISRLPRKKDIQHRPPFSAALPAHRVILSRGSQLASLAGRQLIPVNSAHHQAIRRPAPSLTVCGHAPDGIIEAVEAPSYPFLIGVQWHPELLWTHYEHARLLFAAFINACCKS